MGRTKDFFNRLRKKRPTPVPSLTSNVDQTESQSASSQPGPGPSSDPASLLSPPPEPSNSRASRDSEDLRPHPESDLNSRHSHDSIASVHATGDEAPRPSGESARQPPSVGALPDTESGLWKDAADGLNEEELQSLSQIGQRYQKTVDDVVSEAQKLRDSDEKRWSRVLNKTLKGALAFKALGDAAVQFDQSGYAALAWSVVSFGLQVAANAEEAREFALTSSEAITGLLKRYAEYEGLRDESVGEDFDRLLVDVYRAILLYVIALHDHLNECTARKVGGAIFTVGKRKISERKQAVDHADAEFRNWNLIFTIKRSKDWFGELKKLIEGTIPNPSPPSQQCLQSLAFPRMEDRFEDIKHATDGTCKWLLRHDQFTRWSSCDRSILWIKGSPGTGKSTLLQYALTDAMVGSRADKDTLILWFFFHARGEELQKSPLGFFRAVLHQLLRQVPDGLPELVGYFQEQTMNKGEADKKWDWHVNRLRNFFRSSLLEISREREIVLFLDALDECGEEGAVDLIHQFKTWIEDSLADCRLRICFSSREYPVMDADARFTITVQQENGKDISAYVKACFANHAIPEPVPAFIINGASGIFLWARLVTEKALELGRKRMNWKKIEEEIKEVPRDLNDLYRTLFEEVRNWDHQSEREASLKLMQWICFSTTPLRLREVPWAMVVDPDSPCKSLRECRDSPDFMPDNDVEQTKERIQALTCGLVEVSSADLEEDEYAGTIQFIHETVKSFVLNEGLQILSGVHATNSASAAGSAHYRLARICILYIAMEEVRLRFAESRAPSESEISSLSDSVSSFEPKWIRSSKWALTSAEERKACHDRFPFLRYALNFWLPHARQGEGLGVAVDSVLDDLGWPSESVTHTWVRASIAMSIYVVPRPTRGWSLLHDLARYGFSGLLGAACQRASLEHLNSTDSIFGSPLNIAAHYGSENSVRLLLRTGTFDVNAIDSSGMTPLHLAIEGRHYGVAKALLGASGIDENSKTSSGQTPLHLATIGRFGERRPDSFDINAKAGHGDTALHVLYAAWGVREEVVVVQLLLGKDNIDINSQDDRGETPLYLAASRGRDDLVQLLLGKDDIDVNSPDKRGQTPLHRALYGGNGNVVQLLLGKGDIDVNCRDERGQTPLNHAAWEGFEDMVQLLLGKDDIDVNTQDETGKTPLHRAVYRNNQNVVQLLLGKHDTDVNSKDEGGQTPLHHAAWLGRWRLVPALLESGKADAALKNCDGLTALEVATKEDEWEIVQLLRDYESK